jgi:hypothetical protein
MMLLLFTSKIPIVDNGYLSGMGHGLPEIKSQAQTLPVLIFNCMAFMRGLSKGISFRGHNKIIKVQAFYLSGPPADRYLFPLRCDRRMMAFQFSQSADFIGKRQGFFKIVKPECPGQMPDTIRFDYYPVLQLRHKFVNFFLGQ